MSMTMRKRRSANHAGGSAFNRFLHSPVLEIGLGLMIFLIGLVEVFEEFFLIYLPSPSLHHAFIMLGSVTALRGLIDLAEGVEHIVEAEGEIKEHRTHATPTASAEKIEL
jgi:hypothetical protein